jgi:hypothetical protein
MNTQFHIEFYYSSQNPDQLKILHCIEHVIHGSFRAGVGISFSFFNCDDQKVLVPSHIPGIPCLRRLFPKAERLILGPLGTFFEIASAIGLPTHLNAFSAVGLDMFQGLPGKAPEPTLPPN